MSTEGFLSRWSRRKMEITETTVVEQSATTVLSEEAAPAFPLVEGAPPPELEEEEEETVIVDLPDIDSLDADSDFTVFLQKGVPEELQKLALRKLWRSNPVFANLDGLNDYDEDFTKITPLAEGLAEELKKMMKENSRHEPEVEEPEEELENSEDEETIKPLESDEGDENDIGNGEDDC